MQRFSRILWWVSMRKIRGDWTAFLKIGKQIRLDDSNSCYQLKKLIYSHRTFAPMFKTAPLFVYQYRRAVFSGRDRSVLRTKKNVIFWSSRTAIPVETQRMCSMFFRSKKIESVTRWKQQRKFSTRKCQHCRDLRAAWIGETSREVKKKKDDFLSNFF